LHVNVKIFKKKTKIDIMRSQNHCDQKHSGHEGSQIWKISKFW